MIIVVATVRVHPDKVALYEATCRELLPKVRAAEPDTLFYHVGASHDEPLTYRVIEAYRDESARRHHMTSTFVAAAGDAFRESLADLDIRLHDSLD